MEVCVSIMGPRPRLLLLLLVFRLSSAQISINQGSDCDVNDPLSCDTTKLEVCIFSESSYKCLCPPGIARLQSTRKCTVRNECVDSTLTDCHPDADCFDSLEGYTCQCKIGFIDADLSRPGRVCKRRVDECANPHRYGVNCHAQATCVDTEQSYTCNCLPGYIDVSHYYNQLPGRTCVTNVDECAGGTHQCSHNADCENDAEGYTCRCHPGFVDASPNPNQYPGRICNRPPPPSITNQNEQRCTSGSTNQCGHAEECSYGTGGWYTCQCASNAIRFKDGFCRFIDSCRNNDCDSNAVCSNIFDSYSCQCRAGYADVSPDPVNSPGRYCLELRNECAYRDHNDCSPYADCVDTRHGYDCICQQGYLDISSIHRLPPGRKCGREGNECAHASTHSCDDNADCIDLPGTYTCDCRSGFVDVSSSANLPHGRVCTLHTDCPRTKADLIFVLDGSGSIGSSTFRNEVLRFVAEFSSLFDIGLDKTRIGAIQFSNEDSRSRIIEFQLDKYQTHAGIQRGLDNITYLSGTTFTGSAIRFMVREGFSTARGARYRADDIARIAIVITDGQSQEDVKYAADEARLEGIELFAIGVTNLVDDKQMIEIAGSKERFFHVHDFTDLDVKLRSSIQKLACPRGKPGGEGSCENGGKCKGALNEVCKWDGRGYACVCPDGFLRHPITQCCGGDRCNPLLPSQCPSPSFCKLTPQGIHRCACPLGFERDPVTGRCTSHGSQICFGVHDTTSCPSNERCVVDNKGIYRCVCSIGLERNPRSGKCIAIGSCDPSDPDSCDSNKNQKCLPDNTGLRYSCQCPNHWQEHPITKVCLQNECQSGQHDCDRNALCQDRDLGYHCQCPPNYIDISPNKITQPGRACRQRLNECDLLTHNCSVNAICIDNDFGFRCQCRQGYYDLSPNVRQFPGTNCIPEINECLDGTHDCSPNAVCTDHLAAYTCTCKRGFTDLDALRNPGRRCQSQVTVPPEPHPCDRGGVNDCSQYAYCIKGNGRKYTCRCRDGYEDRALPSGTVCEQKRVVPPGAEECGDNFCYVARNEKCVISECQCIQGYRRLGNDRECRKVIGFPLTLWLMRRNNIPYHWDASIYTNNNDKRYMTLADEWLFAIGSALDSTVLKSAYIDTTLDRMSNPLDQKLYPDQGIIMDFTVYLAEGSADRGALGQALWESIVANNYAVGSTPLYVNQYYGPIDPHPRGQQCGLNYCLSENNEVCRDEDKRCVCPYNFQRREPQSKCIEVDGHNMILWVLRHGANGQSWNRSFEDPRSETYRYFGDLLERGIGETFEYSPTFNPHYITTHLDIYQKPENIYRLWDKGVVYNFTAFFEKGKVPDGNLAWIEMLQIIRRFRHEIGRSSLFISDHQRNPFGVCYRHTCDPVAECIPTPKGPYAYECKCPDGYKEKDVDRRGGLCEGVIDYCKDITRCPGNMTCVNDRLREKGVCQCIGDGYVNIRNTDADIRIRLGLTGIGCLKRIDVPYCALGRPLTDCDRIAFCTDSFTSPLGYLCECPPDSSDQNPTVPGTSCAPRLQQEGCARCHFHGYCVDDAFGNKTCECFEGWTGPWCDVGLAVVGGAGWPGWVWVLLILAILLLLLALCCLGFFCTRLYCCGAGKGAVVSDYSDQYYGQMTIPRAKLRREYDDRASEYSDSSSDYTVVERRVITEEKKVVNLLPSTTQSSAFYLYPGGTEGQAAANMLQAQQVQQKMIQGGETTTYTTSTHANQHQSSQDRELSEYEDMDSDDSRSLPSSHVEEHYGETDGVFDKKTRVKHSRDWVPSGSGKGGLERYTTEHTTTRVATTPPATTSTTTTHLKY